MQSHWEIKRLAVIFNYFVTKGVLGRLNHEATQSKLLKIEPAMFGSRSSGAALG
jgi:hypothetical protein